MPATPVKFWLELMLHVLEDARGRRILLQTWDSMPVNEGPFSHMWGILTGIALLGFPETDEAAVTARVEHLSEEVVFESLLYDDLVRALRQVMAHHDAWVAQPFEPHPTWSDESPLDRVGRIMDGEPEAQLEFVFQDPLILV